MKAWIYLVADKFSGKDIVFTLTEFEQIFERCALTYDFVDIEYRNSSVSNISCSDLTFDGVLD